MLKEQARKGRSFFTHASWFRSLAVGAGVLALLLAACRSGILVNLADRPVAFPRAPMVRSEFIFTQAPFQQCHASTIVELPDGSLLAAWFGGTHEGDLGVNIWGARCVAGSWSSPEVLAGDSGTPCWNPVLFRDRHDRIWLFYKHGSSPKTWKGAYRTSADGATWSAATDLPPGFLGPIKNKPVTLANGNIVAGSSVETTFSWMCWTEISSDDGSTWRREGPISIPWHRRGIIQPALWAYAHGRLKMLARSTLGRIYEATSDDGGQTWSDARPTALPNPNSGIDAVRMKDGTIALVYNHTTTGRSPLNIGFSRDNAETWWRTLTLEDEPGEYSYPAIIQTRDGLLHMTYTWQRRRIKHVVIDPRAVKNGEF
ncbi:MAG TPA: sialidase family protein [Terriglobia bacterium]|nr:sialidase family protein [Terriglobia bacterium]